MRDAILAALNLNIFARHADRVRMANIAQMINVLQAMILTDKEKMVLTPTYHVFKMYVPFQDATARAGHFRRRHLHARRHHACRAWMPSPRKIRRASCGWRSRISIPTSRRTSRPASAGITAKSAAGETLTAPKVDSVNTFEAPNTVVPKAISAKVEGGKLILKLEPKSVTVVSLE